MIEIDTPPARVAYEALTLAIHLLHRLSLRDLQGLAEESPELDTPTEVVEIMIRNRKRRKKREAEPANLLNPQAQGQVWPWCPECGEPLEFGHKENCSEVGK